MRLAVCLFSLLTSSLLGQPYGEPDRGQPGDEMIQKYLASEALRLDAQFAEDVKSKETWEANRERYKQEYFYMLGLWPLPERTDLKATVTGTLERDGYVVEKLHYQSKPGLYVTANVYRPAQRKREERFPAVLYVCGHGGGGRNGVKTVYQSHPIWLAKHGFICLIVDTLELDEFVNHNIHHGTYELQRWWWHSRGYTSAGVECWNGVRGIDYLLSRDDVDPERIGVTGISGGGAATFWIAAADDRVKVAVPISGMADLESYVGNRVINGHCDCMFLYNTFQWPWTRIAGLVAPRPMLFINSDHDRIFPMDANERITNRLERLYSLYGASDKFDTVVSVGGHAYREDIRRATYAFLRYHLQQSAEPVTDSEVDLIDDSVKPMKFPIPPEELRVFSTDADLPQDAINRTIDEHFVPIAQPKLPKAGEFQAWREEILVKLRHEVFGAVPETIVQIKKATHGEKGLIELLTMDGIQFEVRLKDFLPSDTRHNTLIVLNPIQASMRPYWDRPEFGNAQVVRFCEPRGVGTSKWTRSNPPNFVERSHVLVGTTVDAGRVLDVLSYVNYKMSGRQEPAEKMELAGRGPAGLIAAYAALLDDTHIHEISLADPPTTHQSPDAPQFLNILRVCDVPDMLGLIAPRPLKIVTKEPEKFARTAEIYRAAGAEQSLQILRP